MQQLRAGVTQRASDGGTSAKVARRTPRLPSAANRRIYEHCRVLADAWEIQVSDELDLSARTVIGVQELVGFWRDRLDESAIYAAGEEWEHDPKEDFANVVAWYLTSAHRPLPSRG